MSTLQLTIPLTIPQLAQLIRTQFSADERQQLAELMQEPLPPVDESVADSLRQAIQEVNQYKRGQLSLPTLGQFLDELPG